MAKAQPPRNGSEDNATPPARARTGDTTLLDMETALKRLGECQADLAAQIKWMKLAKLDRLTIDGPGLLSRGVNSILQYLGKVDSAIKTKRRMM